MVIDANDDTATRTMINCADARWYAQKRLWGRLHFADGPSGTTCAGPLAPQGSGTAGHPITIDMYGTGSKPRIDGQDNPACTDAPSLTYGAVFLHSQSYWEVQNLELTDDLGGTTNCYNRAGVLVTAFNGVITHIYLQHLVVHDVNGSTIDNAGSYDVKSTGGIVYRDTKDGSTVNGRLDDFLVANNVIHDVGHYDIYYLHQPASPTDLGTQVSIQNNMVYNIGGDGITTQGTSHALIAHNVVHDTGTYNVTAAALWDWDATGDVFQYNEVYHAGGGDGEAFDCDGSDPGLQNQDNIFQYNYTHDNPLGFFVSFGAARCIVRDNISVNDGSSARPLFVRSGQFNGYQIYNNTFYLPTGSSAGIIDGTTPSDATFSNNIIDNQGSGGYANTSGGTWTHNLFYGNTNGLPSDANAIIGQDPLLVNPTATDPNGFKLQSGSPAINAGVNIARAR